MRPIHKFNSGNGATLCKLCYVVISEGFTEDITCNKCKGYENLDKFNHKSKDNEVQINKGVSRKS